jgi:serine/threonine protein kinase/ligand-binding sensor domain-containing protein
MSMNKLITILTLLLYLSLPFVCLADKASTDPKPQFDVDPADLGRPAFRLFTGKNDLPQNAVQAIAVDHKGYLWVGTQGGAAVYNGRKWTVVNMPNKATSNLINDILAASDGSLWFATSGGVSRLKDGEWISFDITSGLPNNFVWDLLETTPKNGTSVLWAATSGGIAHFENDHWILSDMGNQLPSNEALCLLETVSPNGSQILWVGTSGGLARLEEGKWTTFDTSSGLPDNRVQSLLETITEDGSRLLWVGTNNGLGRLEEGKWTIYDKRSGLPDNTVYMHGLLESYSLDGSQVLWVGTYGGGLAQLKNSKWTVYNKETGLPSNGILSLLESVSPQGSRVLWVGTDGGGLVQLESGKWTTYDTASGLPNNSVGCFLETTSEDGTQIFWIGTFGGLKRLENGRWTVLDTNSGLPNNKVTNLLDSVLQGGSRVLWVGTAGGGLARLENGRWTVFDTNSGLPNNFVLCLLETTTENGSRVLWVGTYGGLARLEEGKWTTFDTSSGLPDNQVRSLLETVAEDGSHVLWVGTNNGLARLEKGKWTTFDTKSGLPSNFVFDLFLTVLSNGSRILWVGTLGGGVARFNLDSKNGSWVTLSDSTRPALPDNTVYRIEEDSKHRIYLFTNKGVARLTPRAPTPDDPSEYTIYTFTTEDGLPSNECNQGGSMVDSRGRIWAGTIGGAAIFDPSREIEDQTAKPLYIERTLVGGSERAVSNGLLRYNENNITFEFALLSYFREKETRYRTQLVGFDVQPSEWTDKPERIYTNLPDGNYIFKVWGRDYRDNIRGPVEMTFKIRPAPWRTWWAYLFYTTTLVGIGYGGYRYRLRVFEQRNRELELKVDERTAELAQKNEELGNKNEVLARQKEELARQKEELARRNEELIESHNRADRIFSALAEALPGTLLDEKYRLEEKIGSGGFGAVYRATHLALKRAIAVKVFKPLPGNDSAEALDRFQMEAVSGSRINHPNAVAVLDSGISSEGIAYLVMELLNGHTLKQELRKKRALSIGRAAQILLPICGVLSKAHASGIVHRDIKPENIFLHQGEEGEIVKLVDFGIAKWSGATGSIDVKSLTITGGIIGTPTYMAPERFEGRCNSYSDVYSLGVVLYEILCGQVPFQSHSRDLLALVKTIVTQEPEPIRNINPNVTEFLESVVIKALRKEPDSRPSARELGQEFLKALGLELEDIVDINSAELNTQLSKIRDVWQEPKILTSSNVYQSDTLNAEEATGRLGRIEQFIFSLLERSPQERDEILDKVCGDAPKARRTMEVLLEINASSKGAALLTTERWREIERIFNAALERETAERDKFLDQACGEDLELRQEVEAMLVADKQIDDKILLG